MVIKTKKGWMVLGSKNQAAGLRRKYVARDSSKRSHKFLVAAQKIVLAPYEFDVAAFLKQLAEKVGVKYAA